MSARFVVKHYGPYASIKEMKCKLGWVPLLVRRKSLRLKCCHNICNGNVGINERANLLNVSYISERSDHDKKLPKTNFIVTYFTIHFFVLTIPECNKLPQDVVDVCSN